MRKLANNGQAILCMIHQPSAILMQEFDRLLFLAAGGRTVYFGEVGENCTALTRYFESHGAHPCPPQANPAEWMRARYKFPGCQKIIVSRKWGFANVNKEDYLKLKAEKRVDSVRDFYYFRGVGIDVRECRDGAYV